MISTLFTWIILNDCGPNFGGIDNKQY